MFHLEPVGKHLVEVCTNVSCALVGAQGVLEAFERELGVRAGETTEDNEVTLRAVECFGGCGWGTVVAVDHRYREPVRAEDVPSIVAEVRRMAAEPQRLLLKGADERDLTRLDEYRAIGGYASLEKARGHGAAGRRSTRSWPRTCAAAAARSSRWGARRASSPQGIRYLVVNADESEPGSFKDREIMFSSPHRLIEGCLITAHAIGSEHVFIYIRGEYLREFEILRDALEQVRTEGLMGGVTIVLHRGAGAYICGEESALLESLEGKRGQPRSRPPYPAVSGLYAAPTLINNVETVATVPGGARAGRDEVRQARRAAELDRDPRRLRLGQRRERRQLRGAARNHDPRAGLRPRRRRPGRPQAEGRDPGRLVRARC